MASTSLAMSSLRVRRTTHSIGVDAQFLGFQQDIVQVCRGEVSLAYGAIAVGSEPEPHAVLTELMPTNSKDSCDKRRLADNTYPRLT